MQLDVLNDLAKAKRRWKEKKAVLLSLQTNRAGHSSTDMQRMDTAKPGEPAHLSRESQSRSEAQDLPSPGLCV